MNESNRIWFKYEDQGLLDRLESLDDVNRLALTFCGDVARTYSFDHVAAQPESRPRRIRPCRRTHRRASDTCREAVPISLQVLWGGQWRPPRRVLSPADRVGDHRHLSAAGRRRGHRGLPTVFVQGHAPHTARPRERVRVLSYVCGSARSTVRPRRTRSRGVVQAKLRCSETQSLAPPGKVAVRHLRRGRRPS